ncbi:MAG: hypothetical protein Q9226_003441 [Calogaya cf. arnoldii]
METEYNFLQVELRECHPLFGRNLMISDKISVGSKTRPNVRDGDSEVGKDGEGSREVGRDGEEGSTSCGENGDEGDREGGNDGEEGSTDCVDSSDEVDREVGNDGEEDSTGCVDNSDEVGSGSIGRKGAE